MSWLDARLQEDAILLDFGSDVYLFIPETGNPQAFQNRRALRISRSEAYVSKALNMWTEFLRGIDGVCVSLDRPREEHSAFLYGLRQHPATVDIAYDEPMSFQQFTELCRSHFLSYPAMDVSVVLSSFEHKHYIDFVHDLSNESDCNVAKNWVDERVTLSAENGVYTLSIPQHFFEMFALDGRV